MSALSRTRGLPMWRAFSVRNFRLLWTSEAVSVTGDQFHFVAMAWLIISLTGSGLALGTVMIAIAVPRALLLVPMGVVADRRPSRGLMLTAHVARGVIVGVIAGLVVAHAASIPALIVLGILFGAADAIYLPAQQAFLPRALEADRLPSGNALLQGTYQLASIAGPPLAGVVIAAGGTGAAFGIDAVSFLIAATVVLFITGGRAPAPEAIREVNGAGAPSPATSHESFADSIRAGVHYVLADKAIRTTMLISLVINLAVNGPASVGMPWLASRRFDAGPLGLGLMAAAWAGGALAGTLLAGNLPLRRQGRIIVGSLAVTGLAMAVVGVAGSFLVCVLAMAVMGVAIGYVNVVAISWLQARVEGALLGRVMSLVMLMSFGITPLSLALSGLLIDANATGLFVSAGMLVVLTAVFAVAVGLPRMWDAADERLAPPVEEVELAS